MILSYFRTALLYLLLILSVRLMGKRQIGQLAASEFVVTMLLANLASIPMQDSAIPLYSGLVPILVVLGLELVLSGLLLRSTVLRRILCGKPVILIDNGNLLLENLRRTRLTLDELTAHLRQKEILDIRTVQYAILETDGNLSVFPYPEYVPASAGDMGIPVRSRSLPITLIQDGRLSRENLRISGHDEAWVREQLRQRDTTEKATVLLSVDNDDGVIWLGKETP